MIVVIRSLLATAISLGLIVGNRSAIEKFFDDLIEETQKITTAGDMRTISNMLDYHYLRKGIYPSEKEFGQWLMDNTKENNIRNVDNDNWGNRFVYKTDSDRKAFILTSTGRDGILNTADDMIISGP